MIALLWSMMRARTGRAVITFALAAMAAAAAAAGPLYQAAATASLRSVVVLAEPASNRALPAATFVTDAQGGTAEAEPPLPHLTGSTTVAGAMVAGAVEGAARTQQVSAVWRSGACDHLVIVDGRCATGDREVVVREDVAPLIGTRPGDDVTFKVPPSTGARSDATIQHLTVVGLYEPLAPNDPYWVGREELLGFDTTAVFTTERTLEMLSSSRIATVDLLMSPSTFSDLERLRASLESVGTRLGAGGYFTSTDDVEELIGRLSARQQQLGAGLLLAVTPLVLLCWLVLFIAVGNGMESRRSELGLTALRGVPGRSRWLLATAETALPVLLALAPGYLLAYGLTVLLARFVLPGDPPVEVSLASFACAAVAVLGALVTCMLAQLRDLTTPVTGLLRKARMRRGGRLVGGVDVVVGTLALVAGYQAVAGGSAYGVGLLAPLCISLGLGLLAARAVGVPADRYGRRALLRGRLRSALAALSLARGTGTHGIVVLLVVSFGLLGFALSAADVAGRAWDDRATVESGAARVLSVQPVSAPALLNAVRAADPQGRYAMGVVDLRTAGGSGLLAVDSAGLSSVALWPTAYGPTTADEVGRMLHPRPAPPLTVQASELQVTVTLDGATADTRHTLTLRLSRPSGSLPVLLDIRRLLPGTHIYRLETPACAAAPCVLDEVTVALADQDGYRVDLTVGDIRDGAGQPLITATQLGAHSWRLPDASAAQAVPEVHLGEQGMRLHVDSVLKPDIRIVADSAPVPLPVVTAGEVPGELSISERRSGIAVATAGTLEQIPRYGAEGTLVDLEYLAMRAGGSFATADVEVWLAADAPADMVDRLAANGLVVIDDRSTADRSGHYSQDAPALVLWFLVAAAFIGIGFAAAGLVVTAAFERDRDDRGVSVLRSQGLPASVVWSAALWGRWALVLLGSLIGLAAASVSWLLARGSVPIFGDGSVAVSIPSMPDPMSVLWPVAIAVLVLLAVCVAATKLAAREGETS
jgi:putative ABC transport system permease protein